MYNPFLCFLLVNLLFFIFWRKLFLVSSIFFNFLTHALFNHILKIIIYFQLNQESIISQLILWLFFLRNCFPSSVLHLLQIIERTNAFSNRYDIVDFSNFLYLRQITQYSVFIFLVVVDNLLKIFIEHYFIFFFLIISRKLICII